MSACSKPGIYILTGFGSKSHSSSHPVRNFFRSWMDTKCEVCTEALAKYKCPLCSKQTCSLPCVRRHKVEFSCTGKRSRTDNVRIKDFKDSTIVKGTSDKSRIHFNFQTSNFWKIQRIRFIGVGLMPVPMCCVDVINLNRNVISEEFIFG